MGPEAQQLMVQLGRVSNAASIYGMQHRATAAMMDEAFQTVQHALEQTERITISQKNGVLMVNGNAISGDNMLIHQLITRLAIRQVTAFSMIRGMPRDEFSRLIELLSSAGDENFDKALDAQNLKHVVRDKVTYKEVRESEVVVEKRRLQADKKEKSVAALAEEWLASQSGDGGSTLSGQSGVQEILAFIKGDVSALDSTAAGQLDEMAGDMDKLATLIMEAAAIRQGNPDLAGGESMADLVLGCLRRTYEGLRQSSAMKSPEGRADMRRSLLLLEKNIMKRLRGIMNAQNPAADRAIAEEIRQMNEEWEADGLARDFITQRDIVKRNEQAILAYIEEHGDEHIKEKLLSAGLARYDWQRLAAHGGRHGQSGAAGAAPADIGALAMVLARIDELMQDTHPDQQQVSRLVQEVKESLAPVTVGTERRIEALEDKIRALDTFGYKASSQARETRNLLFASLAEIAQELLQPLTVINCSLNMTLAGYGGPLGEKQHEVLDMAGKSGQRMEQLITKLMKIVGMPAQLSTNKDLLDVDVNVVDLDSHPS